MSSRMQVVRLIFGFTLLAIPIPIAAWHSVGMLLLVSSIFAGAFVMGVLAGMMGQKK